MYPVWLDLAYHETSFNSTTLRFCDDLWWYLTTFYFYMDVQIGFNVCETGVYQYLKGESWNTCAKEYYYLYDLIDTAFGGEMFGNYLINTCGKKRPSWIKVDEPGGPKTDKKDTEWNEVEKVYVDDNDQNVFF